MKRYLSGSAALGAVFAFALLATPQASAQQAEAPVGTAPADAPAPPPPPAPTGLSESVAAVVNAHGGQVSLDSRPGHTCFTIRVPQA